MPPIEMHSQPAYPRARIIVWTARDLHAQTSGFKESEFRAAVEGERKQVTVLFADLKGSMELLADHDPEEARKLLDPILELMMEAVHHDEGTVNQAAGDCIMALFGAPLAHEDQIGRRRHEPASSPAPSPSLLADHGRGGVGRLSLMPLRCAVRFARRDSQRER